MIGNNDIDALRSATAYYQDGGKLGSVGDVYVDDNTGAPTWVTVNTGLFGTKSSFVPVEGASLEGDRLNLGYSKEVISGAPNIDEDGHLSEAEEAELYRYYQGQGYDYTQDQRYIDTDKRFAETGVAAGGVADRDLAVDRDRVATDRGTEVSAKEEQLVVGKEQREAGRVHIRKHVTTENQTVTVPVTKEKLVVERVAGDGTVTDGRIGEDGVTNEEIVLREEVPVVDKQVVERERVRIGKEQVTEQHQVSDQVRKEHIEVQGDGVTEANGVVGDRDRALGKDGFVDADRDGKDDRKLTEKVDNFIDRHDGDADPNR